jgi:MFS family permease
MIRSGTPLRRVSLQPASIVSTIQIEESRKGAWDAKSAGSHQYADRLPLLVSKSNYHQGIAYSEQNDDGTRSLGPGCVATIRLAAPCFPLTPTFAVLLVWRALAGACAALISPTSSLIATSLAPAQQRGWALTIVAIGSSASTVLGVPLGAWIGQQFGWQSTICLPACLACW